MRPAALPRFQPVSVRMHKISGVCHYVIDIDLEGDNLSAEVGRSALATDRLPPELLTVVQFQADSECHAFTACAGDTPLRAGYVITWDRPITFSTNTPTRIRLLCKEG